LRIKLQRLLKQPDSLLLAFLCHSVFGLDAEQIEVIGRKVFRSLALGDLTAGTGD
jgi:hypothetical protein